MTHVTTPCCVHVTCIIHCNLSQLTIYTNLHVHVHIIGLAQYWVAMAVLHAPCNMYNNFYNNFLKLP